MPKIETSPIEWKSFQLKVLDQTLLPGTKKYIICRTHREVAKAISDMKLRGAPLIGVAAALAMAMEVKKSKATTYAKLIKDLKAIGDILVKTRPTAVNLKWAVDRIIQTAVENKDRRINSLKDILIAEANKIYKDDIENNKAIGKYGAELIRTKDTILTHCNAGGLATAGYGTALGVIKSAAAQKKKITVYIDETRPYLQGARLTTFEMAENNINHYLITDNMAGYFIEKGDIDVIIVGADRIAANGDVANKIGTYTLAVLAYQNKIPFYVAAPSSTIDFGIKDGKQIPIEERSENEVLFINGKQISPKKTKALHPAFDVTPARFISAIITEKGIIRPNYEENLDRAFVNKDVLAKL